MMELSETTNSQETVLLAERDRIELMNLFGPIASELSRAEIKTSIINREKVTRDILNIYSVVAWGRKLTSLHPDKVKYDMAPVDMSDASELDFLTSGVSFLIDIIVQNQDSVLEREPEQDTRQALMNLFRDYSGQNPDPVEGNVSISYDELKATMAIIILKDAEARMFSLVGFIDPAEA